MWRVPAGGSTSPAVSNAHRGGKARAVAQSARAPAADAGMELDITFDVAQNGGGAVPYVAVWIEDKDKVPGADARAVV